jgi:hypothetical protein
LATCADRVPRLTVLECGSIACLPTVFPPRRRETSLRTATPAGVKAIPRLEEVPMSNFPPVTHIVITVSDLSRSVPWYQQLIGSDPIVDEDTGPFRQVVFALDDRFLGHGVSINRKVGGGRP